ncbi:hypothetical protein HHX47_DHR1000179 [Lentinula edodes]|nr:hypothetical protein HHX47_DHR1000179 [Lentinula edodes]KAJ3912158.1 hypothetical protein F5877DRAFT_85119 [Lentinula edodes]
MLYFFFIGPNLILYCLVFGVFATAAVPIPRLVIDSDSIKGRGLGVKPYFVKVAYKSWSSVQPPNWFAIKDALETLSLQDARSALNLPAWAIMDYTTPEQSYPAHNGMYVYDPVEFTVNGDGCKGKGVLRTFRKSRCEGQADPKSPRKNVIIKDAEGNIIYSKGNLKWKEKEDFSVSD